MNPDIMIALIGAAAVLATAFSSYMGARTSANKALAIVETKVETLSERVEKHNGIIERTYILEGKVAELEKEIENIR